MKPQKLMPWVLIVVIMLSASGLNATSIQSRFKNEMPALMEKVLSNPTAFKRQLLDGKPENHTRVQSFKQFQTADGDRFEIIYENWEDGVWITTDRYLLSSSLLPIAEDLQDYEGLLILLVFMMMQTGPDGDIGDSIGTFAPLLTLWDVILEVISLFEYALHQEWEDGAWKDDYRITSERDGQDQITQVQLDSMEGSVWTPLMRTTFTHVLSRMTSATLQAVRIGDYTLNNMLKAEMTYLGISLRNITFSAWAADQSTWLNVSKCQYNYNDQLLENNIVQFSVTAGLTWFDIYKIFYTYDGTGLLTQDLTQTVNLDSVSSEMPDPTEPLPFVDDSKTTFAYDGSNNLTDMQSFFWYPESYYEDKWVWDERETYAYDGQNRITVIDGFYGSDHYWEPVIRLTNSFAGDNLYQQLLQEWDYGYLVDVELKTYTYTSGELSILLFQEKEGESWINIMRKLYNYNPAVNVDEPAPVSLPNEFQIRNYPNPFNAITMITYDLPSVQNVTLDIYNLNGQFIKRLMDNRPTAAGSHQVSWPGQDSRGRLVSSGVYIYQLRTESHTTSGRCLLMK
ncbi:T9SS type A sorting domain-containing protein [candidate division KSB1 bacterium]|nr:T9SS type A sorting domain-containing protein [candidate division KSB1 bacterium]